MSEPKAQLLDPQGNLSLPGINATGVITATSLSGVSTSSVTNLTGSPDLNVGIVTGSSFIGQGDGHAANLTGTPQLSLGIATATSFVGDAVGKAAGLTGTPNLNVGLITATGFVGFVTGAVTGNVSGNLTGNIDGNVTGNVTGDVTGNITGNIQGDVEGDVVGNVSGYVTGLASSVKSGASLGVGVATAIQWHGDGSALTGAGSSAYIAQEITATGAETIIDLSYGNLIYYKGEASTTIGFASTSPAEQITFIRDINPNYSISYTTGGVVGDGNGDNLSIGDSGDFAFTSSGDFTIEFWVKPDIYSNSPYFVDFRNDGSNTGTTGRIVWYLPSSSGKPTFWVDGSARIVANSVISLGAWTHLALVRSSQVSTMYVNGVSQGTWADSTFYGNAPLVIGQRQGTASQSMDGVISNFRILKGTALYTNNFTPPSAALTNITNSVLLCCQSNSSATAAAVYATPEAGGAGSITANGDISAAAQTISLNGSLNATITWPDRVKWNNNTTPTLIYNEYTSAFQTFRLTTVDTGLNYNAWEEMQSTAQQVSLWFWGRASYGTSGLNDRTRRSSPTQIPGQWSSKFFGSRSNLVASIPKVDGTLWSWGYQGGGNLGLNDIVSRSSPTQVGTDTTWKQSSSGSGKQALAIKTNGTLWSWGGNDFGDLGQNYAHENGRVSSPTQVGTGSDWKQVSADASSSTGFKTDGTLWVWGANGDGALGLNNTTTISSPAQIPGTTWDSTTVTNAGDTYARGIIKTDGTLWVWGRNQEGDLGQNKSGTIPQGGVYYSSPTQMGTGTDWASVSQCGNSGLGTKTDGTLWAWGSKGSDGSLGQNQAPAQGTDVSSPIQIPGTTWAAIPGVSSASYAVYAMKYSPSP